MVLSFLKRLFSDETRSEHARTRAEGPGDGGELARGHDRRADDGQDELLAALSALTDRLESVEQTVEQLQLDWADTLQKISKIGNKLAAQARRDLDRAAQMSVTDGDQPTNSAPPGADRALRKAQLRARLRGGAQRGS